MDRLTHKVFTENIDVAADHYNRYREDLGYAKELKVKDLRFRTSGFILMYHQFCT